MPWSFLEEYPDFGETKTTNLHDISQKTIILISYLIFMKMTLKMEAVFLQNVDT
jgi:hypothetical protein